jgi:hypothetical protein
VVPLPPAAAREATVVIPISGTATVAARYSGRAAALIRDTLASLNGTLSTLSVEANCGEPELQRIPEPEGERIDGQGIDAEGSGREWSRPDDQDHDAAGAAGEGTAGESVERGSALQQPSQAAGPLKAGDEKKGFLRKILSRSK